MGEEKWKYTIVNILYYMRIIIKSIEEICEKLKDIQNNSKAIPPPPRDLPDPGINLVSLTSPALAGGFFTTSTIWEAQN